MATHRVAESMSERADCVRDGIRASSGAASLEEESSAIARYATAGTGCGMSSAEVTIARLSLGIVVWGVTIAGTAATLRDGTKTARVAIAAGAGAAFADMASGGIARE